MEALTQEHITFLRMMGIPKESAEIISDYFPKDNEDFGKNFGQSSYSLVDPKRFFSKIFEIMNKYFDIHLDFISHGCGDSYIVNPDIDFQVIKDESGVFDYKNNYLTGGYGKYGKNFGYKGVKRWNLILKK